jgi:branched-chain amino acid aminotransferase
MTECFGSNFILNGKLLPSGSFNASLVYEGDSVYEVIRMVRGIPVFFHDHMDRLVNSARIIGKDPVADINVLKNSIFDLINAESKKETNLKIVFNYNNGPECFLVYFIEPIYPSHQQYKKGVKGILFHAERKNPESKIINHKLRAAIYHRLILDEAYEALLVNEQNEITEGSRSNIFFLKEGSLVTAPDRLILGGITRKHILDICNQNNIGVELRCVNESDIAQYDSVFMTGTSPMVLPFCCIDDKKFDVEFPLMETLRQLFIARAEESIRLFMSE